MTNTRGRLSSHELVISSAAATLYGALAVAPSLLVAIALAALLLGRDQVHQYGRLRAGTLPTAMGASGAADRMVDAGLALSPIGVVFAVVMGSAYGEGLSRAFVRVTPALRTPHHRHGGRGRRRTRCWGWRR